MTVDYQRARKLWKGAECNQWLVAHLAFKCKNRTERLDLAGAIDCHESTVDNLTNAYRMFGLLVIHELGKGQSSESVRTLRRRYPYTRWMTVYRAWKEHEFPLDEARDWLENFDGSNEALGNELENKHGAPEWERRAARLYRETKKLSTDFGVPRKLQRAAKYFVKVYDTLETT